MFGPRPSERRRRVYARVPVGERRVRRLTSCAASRWPACSQRAGIPDSVSGRRRARVAASDPFHAADAGRLCLQIRGAAWGRRGKGEAAMANQKSASARRARFKRGDRKRADRGTSQNGNSNVAASYEQELALYLQERIKPGLKRGSTALLARSIAKEIAHQRPDEDADVAGEPSDEQVDDVRDEVDDDDVRGEADDDVRDEEADDVRGGADDEPDDGEEDDDVQAETDDDFSDEEDGNEGSLEDELRDLQASLGDNWILRVSLQGEDAWLTAEKDDGSQHVEARAAHVLTEVVELLNESGGRASASRESH